MPTISMSGLIASRRGRHAADQPAPADRDDQHVEVGDRGEHFERDRPRPGDDRGIVERVDEDQPLLGLEFLGMRMRIVEALAVEDDGRAMALGLGDLHRRGADRHDDGHRDAEPLAVIGHRLRMVAGRRRDHAARAFVVVQREQFVERAAFLVGRGELQILELQPDVGAGDVGQGAAAQRRRGDDRARDARGGGLDVGEGRKGGGGRYVGHGGGG